MKRKDIADFLNTIIVNKKYVYLSYWNYVHFISGVLFFIIWSFFSKNVFFGFLVWLLVQIVWEFLEFLLALATRHKLFNETFVDVVCDIITGTAGYVVVWLILI